ncbi:MAG: hypothetical protein KIT56_09515 [Gammaproteobacteria bacterium]|nr:hypothetical protein [Gammaproteobacteria bacterium]MCW5584090.1 hypothetical protein [Gammaproteobacteria bacterium]
MNNYSDNKYYGIYFIKVGILFFFFLWFSIAFSSNFIDFLNSLGITNEWRFHSGNYDAVKKTIQIYNAPQSILNFLFYSDILIQATSALLFFAAFLSFFRKRDAWRLINSAYGISMALWAIFLIIEEIFIAYSYEAAHIRLLLELVSFLLLHLLPDNKNIS